LTNTAAAAAPSGQVLMSDELEKVASSMFNGKVSQCLHRSTLSVAAGLASAFSPARLYWGSSTTCSIVSERMVSPLSVNE
jgi:hypothetical protein